MKKAGDVKGTPEWQIRGAYEPPDSLRDLEFEQAVEAEEKKERETK